MRLNRLSAVIIALAAIAIIPMANIAGAQSTNSSTPASSNGSPSPIESASRSETTIFKIYVGFLVIAALGTALLTVLTWRASSKVLDAVKADADVRIERVKAGAKTDSERIAQEGRDNIAALDRESRERIAAVESAANVKLADANRRTAELEKGSAELTAKNLKLAKELADTEKASYPRTFDQYKLAKALEEFKGTPVILQTIPDFEARRTMALLATALAIAHWKVLSATVLLDAPLTDFFFTGISIQTGVEAHPELNPRPSEEEMETSLKAYAASRALVNELKKSGIDAWPGGGNLEDLQQNVLRIRIRLKTMPGQPGENLLSFPIGPQ